MHSITSSSDASDSKGTGVDIRGVSSPLALAHSDISSNDVSMGAKDGTTAGMDFYKSRQKKALEMMTCC